MNLRWCVVMAGTAMAAVLGSYVGSAAEPPKKPALEVPRPIPAGPSWNLPVGGIDWARLVGRVVVVDFWNQK